MNDKPVTPKRGALPTPKNVIDEAPRYSPDAGVAHDEQGEASPQSPDRKHPRHEHDPARDEDEKYSDKR